MPEEKVVKAEAEADSLNVPDTDCFSGYTSGGTAEGITEIRMERFLLVEKGEILVQQ